jgi:hypothetical protein
MSIGNVGPSGGPPQGLAALLAQLSPTQSIAGTASRNDGDFDSSSQPASNLGAAISTNALTGGSKAPIGDEVLALLTKLQQHSDSAAGTTSAPDPTHSGSPNASQFSTAIRAFQNANSSLSAGNVGSSSVLRSPDVLGQTAALLGSTVSVIA